MRKKILEGTWFAVPLFSKKYVVGIAARMKRSCLLGYFLGPKRINIPGFEEIRNLKAQDAEYIRITYDSELKKDKWPILGRDENWNRDEFPMPVFKTINKDRDGKVVFVQKTFYGPNNPEWPIKQKVCSLEEVEGLPDEGLSHPEGSLLTNLEKVISDKLESII